jgi:hypothetical protein
LSEIAFTLLFVLLLLLGFMLLQERRDKDAALAQLAASVQAQDAQAAESALREAKTRLEEALKRQGVPDPQKLVAAVAAAGAAAAERDRLQQQIQDLNQKLVALEELRDQVQRAGQKPGQTLSREQIEQALALKSELRHQVKTKLKREIAPGQEIKELSKFVDDARTSAELTVSQGTGNPLAVENARLRTQVSFFEKRDKMRGLDHLPCWMDSQLKPEFIFNVQTTATGVVVTRGWPAHRETEARNSPGFEAMTAHDGAAMNVQQFAAAAASYLDYGRKQSPECRHFVYLSSTIADADRRDEARRLVNGFFYVLERKSPVTP